MTPEALLPFVLPLVLPLVLATVFTVGCVAIHKAGRHAERVTETLGLLFIVCAFLCVLALLARETGMPLGGDTAAPRFDRLAGGHGPRPVF